MKPLSENQDITQLSNFRTKAIAKYYFEINQVGDIEVLYGIIQFAEINHLKYVFIWWWTNVLFAFEVYEGIIIKNNLLGWQYDEQKMMLKTYSAEKIWDIASSLENDYHQNIRHRFIWLPGTIGWAIYGNAGCFWLEIENNFLSAYVLNLETGKKEILSKKDMLFSYRSSLLKNNNKYFLIEAYFDISQKIEKYASNVDNIYFREHSQPKWYSCGSFFKNPSQEQSAGYLIESVGLKGCAIGWAYFSPLHANFLMHDGTGTYKDLISLMHLAQQKIKEQFKRFL